MTHDWRITGGESSGSVAVDTALQQKAQTRALDELLNPKPHKVAADAFSEWMRRVESKLREHDETFDCAASLSRVAMLERRIEALEALHRDVDKQPTATTLTHREQMLLSAARTAYACHFRLPRDVNDALASAIIAYQGEK